MKLVRVKEAAEDYTMSPHTLYAWRYQNKYPGLFATLGRIVYVDEDELRKIVRASKRREYQPAQAEA